MPYVMGVTIGGNLWNCYTRCLLWLHRSNVAGRATASATPASQTRLKTGKLITLKVMHTVHAIGADVRPNWNERTLKGAFTGHR